MMKRIVNMVLSVMLVSIIGCNANAASTGNRLSSNALNDYAGIGVMQMVKDSVQVHYCKRRI